MATLELHAQNIKCGGCVSNIQSGLSAMAGIDSVDVDIPTGKVDISGSDLDAAAITAKLAELGYPVAQD